MSAKWTLIRVPTILSKQIEEILEESSYPSKSQFVSEAIRRRIEEFRRKKA